MRTTKRFTPSVLERFRKQARGLGTYQDYIPWHRVGRGDPSSRGRSHLQQWNGRQRELLSDHEWVMLFFAITLLNLLDIREQFPLSKGDAPSELGAYRADVRNQLFPGTLTIAKRLGIKHPKTTDEGKSDDWVMSTDFLLLLKQTDGTLELLAIAVKPLGEITQKRKEALLTIEREYWAVRGITWLLITPGEYDERVAINLRMNMPWALGEAANGSAQHTSVSAVQNHPGRSLTFVLNKLCASLGDMDFAQRAFWQAVWSGKIPLDLRRGWRPHLPIVLLQPAAFSALNPIASRRSAWI